jgi:signal transduction histidine kinase
MKRLRVLVWVVLFLVSACKPPGDQPGMSSIPGRNRSLIESVSHLDSLVQSNKLTHYSKAYEYARHALALGLISSSPEVLAKAYSTLGYVYLNKQNDSAYYYYSKALKLVTDYHLEDLRPGILFRLSSLYKLTSDYGTSVTLLQSIIEPVSRSKDYALLSNIYNSLGHLKHDLNDIPGARVMFDSAYSVAKRHSLVENTGVALGNLALYEQDKEKSLSQFRNALAMLKHARGTEVAQALVLINMAFLFKDPDSAIWYNLQAVNMADSGGSSDVFISGYNNLASRMIDKGQYDIAEEYLVSRAMPMARKDENYDWLSTLYDTWYEVLLAKKQFKEAAKAERMALEFRDEDIHKRSADKVSLVATLWDVKNKELRIIRSERALQAKEIKIQRVYMLFACLAAVAVLGIFLLILFYQRRKLKYERRLVSTARRLLDLEENFKGRIAMELHDLTGPIYNQLLRQIESTDIPDPAIREELQAKLSDLAGKIRHVSHKMNDVYLEHLTFNDLVSGTCREIQDLYDVRIHYSLPQEPVKLSRDKATHIIRIIQELLNNGVKYIGKGEIRLSVSEEFGNINVIYTDTGPGFSPKEAAGRGMGLANIVERAKLMGGNAILDAAPGKGTHWLICIPSKNHD